MLWTGITNNELVWLFRVRDGVKITSSAYIDFVRNPYSKGVKRKT